MVLLVAVHTAHVRTFWTGVARLLAFFAMVFVVSFESAGLPAHPAGGRGSGAVCCVVLDAVTLLALRILRPFVPSLDS